MDTNNFRTIVVTLVLLALVGCGGSSSSSTPSSQQNIYIDATVTGNGSQTQPYQTLSVLSSLTYTVPTTIYLKRGTVWNEPLILPGSNITVDAYGSGALPQINGARQVFNWVSPLLGIYSSVVNLGTGEALGNLSENGVMMRFVPWNTDIATTFASAPAPASGSL